jgi:hypothetical protein
VIFEQIYKILRMFKMSFRIHPQQPIETQEEKVDKTKITVKPVADPTVALLQQQVVQLQQQLNELKSQVHTTKAVSNPGLIVPTRAAFSYSPCASPRR